jgi:hypothetical protein
MVVKVFAAVTLGVNISIEQYDELTLNLVSHLLYTFVARAGFLAFLPSSLEPGLQNCLNL